MEFKKAILAVITTDPSKVGGGAPIFFCESSEELALISVSLEAIMDGIVHQLTEDVFIVVKH